MHFNLVNIAPVRIFAASPGEPPEGKPHGGKGTGEVMEPSRVLIVEDESLVAMNIELALVEAGFRVVAVVDTEKDAIEAAQRLKPDVVLMDITLRDGDGLAAASEIYRRLQLPVIFITGNTDLKTLNTIKQLPSAGLIRKPFVSSRLAALVRDAVAGKA
jgi:two-component system, response regulator PdtaR